MSYIIRATDISKKYNSNYHQTVLKPTQFTIKKGAIYVIEGKSGSGKSTFLSILGGMEKPTQGKVFYKNYSLYDLDDKEQAKIRGEKFGFVFQSFQLIPELTVKENIKLPLQFIDPPKNKKSVKELAEELGIISHLNKKPTFLSGGEQQRVAIARALITSPEVIFADEPTGNLDQFTSKIIVDVLTKLCTEQQVSLVVVTHEKNLFHHPHNLYTMQDGKLKVEFENV
ncbi:ABC transporter ATP-binding protein [Neobacillus sedimentimangrovi]|uniref:ABC transporter ATP-binding protein n=1 Tax=Neobacillus sedimentimangrovi TaxID=2699460 RepID=A0ABS8QEA0_9BACI|nr:ABC transporter ATP-binding protein [Neobacillus sedimentimangrovi]